MSNDKPDVWMPLFIGDYLADTQRLTTEQHGAYLLLIMDYWRNGPPPNDDAVLAQITRLPMAAWKKHRNLIVGFFSVTGGTLVHKRIDKEIGETQARKDKAVAKAKTAAEKRWGKQQAEQSSEHAPSIAASNAPSMLQALPQGVLEQCPSPSPSPSQLLNVIEGKPAARPARTPKARKTSLPDGFGVSERVARWALEKGFGDLPAHLESFLSKAKAKGYEYVDWDEAFMTAIREDWAKLSQVRSITTAGTKFDPVAHVNRNRFAGAK